MCDIDRLCVDTVRRFRWKRRGYPGVVLIILITCVAAVSRCQQHFSRGMDVQQEIPESKVYFERIATIAFEESHQKTAVSAPEHTLAKENGTAPRWERGNGGLDDGDRLLLLKLYSEANSVFEFGLGESTRIAAVVGTPRYSGVDSSASYVSSSREQAPQWFKFYFADVGRIKAWGVPVDVLPKQAMQSQIAALYSELAAFDIYFVDGRYRVGCVCSSFLHASKYNKVDVAVLVHDYSNRPEYHVIESFAEIVDRSPSGKLVRLSRRSNASDIDIYDVWNSFRQDASK